MSDRPEPTPIGGDCLPGWPKENTYMVQAPAALRRAQSCWDRPVERRLDISTIIVISYKHMETSQVIEALGALAHEYRLAIFRLLIERGPDGLPAGAIGERVGLVPSSLTFHLQALKHAGLIRQLRASRQLIYSADFDAMNELVGYLTDQCCVASAQGRAMDCRPARATKAARRRKAA
jgi:ArsR family transcriptional regulator, arsenate/arsenite/antimonite-responsive transcriptional repressor